MLVGAAVERYLGARQEAAAYALIVDDKGAGAVSFHQHYGFAVCRAAQRTLYLAL